MKMPFSNHCLAKVCVKVPLLKKNDKFKFCESNKVYAENMQVRKASNILN